jgi:DNA-binding CsgD family transcriptional regulator
MEHRFAPDLFGLVLLDSEWRVISANAEAFAALQAGIQDPSSAHQHILDGLATEIARHMQTGKGPKTFAYGGCTCTVMRFSCAYGTGDQSNVGIIRRTGDNSRFITSFSEVFNLTPRESQSLALCVRGHGTKEIAHKMGISVSTAKSFLRLVSIKMGVTSRAEILSKVLDSMCEASMTCPFRGRCP